MSAYRNSAGAATPMKIHRLASLFFAFAFAVISGSVGLNALIKSNQQQSKLRKLLPEGTTLDVNVDDVFHTGVIVTAVSALVALLTLIYVLLLPRSTLSTRALPIQWSTLLFCSTWILAVQIPFTVFFATRSAKVQAFIGSVPVPAAIVQAVEKELGATSVYKDIGYLRLVAILPWFTILFTAIAGGVAFVAWKASRRRVGVSSATAIATEPVPENEGKDKGLESA